MTILSLWMGYLYMERVLILEQGPGVCRGPELLVVTYCWSIHHIHPSLGSGKGTWRLLLAGLVFLVTNIDPEILKEVTGNCYSIHNYHLEIVTIMENHWCIVCFRRATLTNIHLRLEHASIIMAWCRAGNKPLFEPMMVSLPMHIP